MNENIQKMRLEDIMGERFGRYSKYIIQERALPDARDGLKPVQRRILFAMHKGGNSYDKGYRKSAKSVGDIMGNYHPHGDSSIYEAMVRMSQDWKYKQPLIDMHGNNGSIDGDPAAAMRYTEARLSEFSSELLRDIDKDLVELIPNFDDTMMEPVVLPAFYPNLLVNGATGISAGYATDIPPHNLEEIINATIFRMKNVGCGLKDLLKFVKGPDFPTGAIIQGENEICKAYETGKGRIIVRSICSIEKVNSGRQQIVVTEIPYEVNKGNLVKKIDELRIDKKAPGISEVRDETDRNELRIVVELKKDANADMVLKYLLKNTDLQVSYNINMVAIHNKRPVLMGLMPLLDAYIAHQKDVVTNRANFDLKRAKTRQHIVSGLIKMVSIIDEVVATIRASNDKADSRRNLVSKFVFTEEQAEAIVTLQLYRLSNTDITALEAEAKELEETIARLTAILGSEIKLLETIESELNSVKKKFKEARRTKIEAKIEEIKIDAADLIAKEDVMVAITRDGYVKRTSLRSYVAAKTKAPDMKEGDELVGKFATNTVTTLLAFTKGGHYIFMPVFKLPEIKWKDLGSHLSNLVNLDSSEKILAAYIINDFKANEEFLMATKSGQIKRGVLSDFEVTRYSKTMVAMAVKDDELVSVTKTTGAEIDDVILVTKKGFMLKYPKAEIAPTGLKSKGIRGINLSTGDELITALDVNNADVLTVTNEKERTKNIKMNKIEPARRATKGVLATPASYRLISCVKAADAVEGDDSYDDSEGQLALKF